MIVPFVVTFFAMYVCMYVSMYVCVYVCTYVYMGVKPEDFKNLPLTYPAQKGMCASLFTAFVYFLFLVPILRNVKMYFSGVEV